MADNLGYTPGVGVDVATEEVGGVHHQKVLIEYGGDDGVTPTPVSTGNPIPVHDLDAHIQMARVISALSSPQGYDRSLQRQRVTAVVESGTVTTVSTVSTVTTVTTVAGVTTVTGLTNIDGRPGSMLINQTNLSAWADCVRARIS